MYRMRRWPAPLSVTLPPPSSTTTGEVLTTLAVAVMTMVTGLGPAVEGDDPAVGHGVDHRLRRAARRRPVADHDVGVGGVDGLGVVGQGDAAGVAGRGGDAAGDGTGRDRAVDPGQHLGGRDGVSDAGAAGARGGAGRPARSDAEGQPEQNGGHGGQPESGPRSRGEAEAHGIATRFGPCRGWPSSWGLGHCRAGKPSVERRGADGDAPNAGCQEGDHDRSTTVPVTTTTCRCGAPRAPRDRQVVEAVRADRRVARGGDLEPCLRRVRPGEPPGAGGPGRPRPPGRRAGRHPDVRDPGRQRGPHRRPSPRHELAVARASTG